MRLIRRYAVILWLLAVAWPSATVGQVRPLPGFGAFPVDTSFRGPPATVDLSNVADDTRLKAILEGGIKNGPNFAGAFIIVEWGCGSPCRTLAIVDARSGKVFLPGLSTVKGFVYQRNSSLLVTEPLDEWKADLLAYPDWEPLVRKAYYFNWQSPYLIAVDSVVLDRSLIR